MTNCDPSFPRLHGRPDRGWINDPNGLAVIDGKYHVFFQYNPDAPVHATIHWGHASSTDLVRWQQEPIALVPRADGPDEWGCFSGCLTDDGGTPTAVYTGIVQTGYTGVVLATSDRSAVSWVQEPTVLAHSDEPRGIGIRDPYLFSFAGRRYAVQGGGLAGGKSRVLLYGCDNLREWTFLGDLVTSDDPVAAPYAGGGIWECPNLFELDGSWVLVASPLIADPDPDAEQDALVHGEVFALIGHLEPDGDGLRFCPRSASRIDGGPSFYAPQVLSHGERRLLWGWTKDLGRSPEAIAAAGWAGSLTFPREVRLVEGTLRSEPVPELVGLRRERLTPADGIVSEASFELEGRLDSGAAGVRLILMEDDSTEVVVDVDSDRTRQVRILVDGSVIEVFADDLPPQTLRAYPGPGSRWRVEGGRGLRVWRLGLPPADVHDHLAGRG